jgi:hypothetical protein
MSEQLHPATLVGTEIEVAVRSRDGIRVGEFTRTASTHQGWEMTQTRCPYCRRRLHRALWSSPGVYSRVVRVFGAPSRSTQRVLVQRIPGDYDVLICRRDNDTFVVPKAGRPV